IPGNIRQCSPANTLLRLFSRPHAAFFVRAPAPGNQEHHSTWLPTETAPYSQKDSATESLAPPAYPSVMHKAGPQAAQIPAGWTGTGCNRQASERNRQMCIDV